MPEPSGSAQLVSEEDIRLILSDERRLSLVSQPVIDLRRGVVAGYETLARFELEQPAAPDHVFASANCVGLGEQLEALVVRRALGLLKYIPENCFLAINVDPGHLISDPVTGAILAQGNLSNVVFELTEHRPIADLEAVARWLAELRKLGSYTAMDDAGSGYVGLKQIHVVRPQFLKIDRSLVANVHLDEVKRAMIQMLGDLAGRIDAWIVAEGIESEAELHALVQLGVPLGQGYYLARPALGCTQRRANQRSRLEPGRELPDVRSTHGLARGPRRESSTGRQRSTHPDAHRRRARRALPSRARAAARQARQQHDGGRAAQLHETRATPLGSHRLHRRPRTFRGHHPHLPSRVCPRGAWRAQST
jgi:EAL domain-containing protein (putative c-di-GMP-specific phosphodiesterase class I)